MNYLYQKDLTFLTDQENFQIHSRFDWHKLTILNQRTLHKNVYY